MPLEESRRKHGFPRSFVRNASLRLAGVLDVLSKYASARRPARLVTRGATRPSHTPPDEIVREKRLATRGRVIRPAPGIQGYWDREVRPI